MTNKEKYRKFCKTEENIPIFCKDWWLDAVCGEHNWDVVLVEKGGQISASLPFYKTKKSVFNVVNMPMLTQFLGPYIKYPVKQKYYKKLSWEKKMMEELISKLPPFDYFSQAFDKKITNWLPFYWADYKQTTLYSYVINNISIEELEKNFETDIRRRIKKAANIGVVVSENTDIKKFYKLNCQTFIRQNKPIPYSFDFVNHLYKACKENNSCKMYFAEDEFGETIAANFLVYDSNTVYYLMGGIDAEKRDLGGMDVVQHESIKFALENGREFDFEGSMIESIEKYFRSFGSIQQPYSLITKTNSKLLKIRELIKNK